MLMAVGSTVILLLVSAEVALSFTVGVIGYFTVFGFRRGLSIGWRYWTRYALFVLCGDRRPLGRQVGSDSLRH